MAPRASRVASQGVNNETKEYQPVPTIQQLVRKGRTDKVSKSKNANFGYDAAHDTFGDMIENGIVDPTKVCRSALENAASVSSMVLTTESLVADLPEKAAPAAPAAPDMGGMY